MSLPVGSTAPDFTLKTKTADGLQDIRLGDQLARTKVVLLFFPLAFTGVCTTEMCSVTQDLDAFAGLDAAVFGISVDSPFAQEAWAKQNEIRIPLLSDFNKEVSAAYGVQYADLIGLRGVAKRSAFVIGRDGKVAYSWSSDDPKVLPDLAAVKAALQTAS